MKIKYKFYRRGHWWFDAGLIGFYQIAEELAKRKEVGLTGKKIWPDVSVVMEHDGVMVEAPDDRLKEFSEACYAELAARWWNRSTEKQQANPDVVCYNRETGELKCFPKRQPTPVPNLFVGGSSWRAEGDVLDALPPQLQEKVKGFLEENKKSLWGSKKKLCYEQPVCHPKWEDMKVFEKPKRGKGQVCSICGRMAVCDKVSQTSYPLFSSQSATFSFDSELNVPDPICGECQLLGKFAVQAAFYKKVDDLTYILQLSGGDLLTLRDAHEIFGDGMKLRWSDAKKIYFSNFDEEKTVLQYANLTYEILWGLYLKAYDLVMENQQKRYEESQELEDWYDEDLDGESLKHVAALTVFLVALASKGNTFITREIVSYSDAAYVFRLIYYLKKSLRADSSETLKKDSSRFFELLFGDFLLPNPQKPYDPLNGMVRNRVLQLVFEKKSILRHVEKCVFEKSMSDYPWLGRILFFVTCYEIAIHRRDTEEGEGTGMTKEQIEIARKLGAQIVINAKEVLLEGGDGVESMKSVKGDLFALRKTRTVKDFLEQLNRLQFRYGIVVNKEIAGGILAEPQVSFEDFKAYCMISALNAYNNIMRPRSNQENSEN